VLFACVLSQLSTFESPHLNDDSDLTESLQGKSAPAQAGGGAVLPASAVLHLRTLESADHQHKPCTWLLQGKSAPVRRLAELHFKAGLALQFQNRAAPALTHTQARASFHIA